MNYTEALERAKSTPVMRRHWINRWLTWENGKHFQLKDDSSLNPWFPLEHESSATDWVEAPKPIDEF
jgi:hypothetical protein